MTDHPILRKSHDAVLRSAKSVDRNWDKWDEKYAANPNAPYPDLLLFGAISSHANRLEDYVLALEAALGISVFTDDYHRRELEWELKINRERK